MTDHGGEDWNPDDGATLTGEHTNIGTFTITGGETCNVATGIPFKVYATTVVVAGTINGNGKGYSGGAVSGNGAGAGGGTRGLTNIKGGGGGAYGGDGGDGQGASSSYGWGGDAYGDADGSVIQMGSGGGGGDTGGGGASGGGAGGGSVFICANTVTITGTIQCDGNTAGSADSSGGGGSGGGICIITNDLTCTAGALSADGGNGGTSGDSADGGGAGGGRAKFIYSTTDVDPKTKTTVALGVHGVAGGTDGLIGTEDTEAGLGKSDATHVVGQTFNFDTAGAIVVTKVILKASAANSGSHTLTIWDSKDKVTNYGSVANTIDTTADETWTFANPLELPDGETDYYMELTRASGDCTLNYTCKDLYAGGVLYCNGEAIDGVDLYMKIYSYAHIINPKIYNVSDTDLKCRVADKMLTGAVHTINHNGSGHIDYADNITTSKYIGDRASMSGVTYDDANNELDVASDGYIYYKINTKYPIVGIPTLSAQVDIDTGTPTIQIAKDLDGSPDTWYDITDAIVDNVNTEYDLHSDDLEFEGKTIIYFRFNFSGATGSIVSFDLDVDINTATAQIPVVDVVGDSTFRCDQDAASSLACTVELGYNDCKY